MTGYTDRALTNQEAWLYMDQLLSDERVGWYDNEPPDLMQYWREYSDRATSSHLLWMDAYLAAFARAAGLTLVTLDKAFRQFPGLDVLILGDT